MNLMSHTHEVVEKLLDVLIFDGLLHDFVTVEPCAHF